MNIAVMVACLIFVLIFLLRMPIPLGMVSLGVVYFLMTGADVSMAANKIMGTYYSNYVIIAVPLFIFTACVMNSGKVTEIVFKFANGVVGNRRGGLGHVNVLASLIFSGMTGSAIADASGLGTMEIEAMRKEGYDDGFSCAITAASATIGPIFPPSIPMVIYSMLSGASVGALFMGGMIPGILLGVALMVYIAIIAKKRNYPLGKKMVLGEFLAFTLKSIPALVTPVILLGGIYAGVMTPTEAGAVAGAYAILISIFIYRSLGFGELYGIIRETVLQTGTVSLMVGAASVTSYIVAREQVAASVGVLILDITDSPLVFLMLVNLVFIILGMFVDTSTIQLVFVPMVLPVVNTLGIDLVHFGIVICLNMMIGLSTPPFGMLLFITSGVSGTPLNVVIKEIFWPLVTMTIVLLIVTLVPDIVLFIPRHFGN